MGRFRVSFISLSVVLVLGLGLVDGGSRPAAAQAPVATATFATSSATVVADQRNVELVGHLGGTITAVAVQGTYA
jgi:hypothetical protein